jgi:hypothetical protein
MAFVSAGPLGGRIRRGDELRCNGRRSTESGIIENSQILLDGAGSVFLCFPLSAWYRTLLVGIRCDQAGIYCKSFRANQPLSEAAFHYRLEHMPQDIALPEPAMAVLREAGMIRDLAVQTEAAEPAIGEIKMDLLAQSAFRADTHRIADDQHSHHKLGINGGATSGAVERLQLCPDTVELEMAVNPAQQVISRNVIIKAEVVEKLRWSCLTSHHRSILRKSMRRLNHDIDTPAMPIFNPATSTRSF